MVNVRVDMPKRRKCTRRHGKTTSRDGNFYILRESFYIAEWFFDMSTRGILMYGMYDMHGMYGIYGMYAMHAMYVMNVIYVMSCNVM